jgi:hypothetical protein
MLCLKTCTQRKNRYVRIFLNDGRSQNAWFQVHYETRSFVRSLFSRKLCFNHEERDNIVHHMVFEPEFSFVLRYETNTHHKKKRLSHIFLDS